MVIDKDNLEMFEVFCEMHPHEAYDLDKEKFCDYMQKEGHELTNEEIEKLINETR